MSSERARSGVFTPVVLMVLAIFAILGVTYHFSAGSDYGQSAQVIYTLKAQMLAQAALEEAQTVIYDRVNRPTRAPTFKTEWKKPLFDKVEEAVKAKTDGSATGPIIFEGADAAGWINILRDGMVTKVKDLAKELSREADVTEVKVKFYGFRKIGYNKEGSFYDKDSYYAHDTMDKDVPMWVPNDYIGYYTLRATAKSRGQTRSLARTHDIKVVNVAPIANEFAMFQMLEVKNQQHSDTDLNQGGALRVYPRGWGRAFMRGPYTVESEGLPDGEGGWGPVEEADKSKTVSNFFFPIPMDGDKIVWHGWHGIPNPRAGVMKRSALVFPVDQARPFTKRTGFVATIVGGVTNAPIISTIGSAATALGADPGPYIPENTVWYTGFKAPTDKEFSLYGDPSGKLNDGFGLSVYRGLSFRLESGSREPVDRTAYWPIDDIGDLGHKRVGAALFDPRANKDSNWYIMPEAQLKLKVRVVKMNTPGLNWGDLFRLRNPFNITYNISPEDSSSSPGGVIDNQMYGIHWEPQRTRGILDSVLDAVRAITPTFMYFNPAFLIFQLDPRTFWVGTVPAGPDDSKNGVPKKSLPTNFKGVYSRAATRVYKKAGRIRSLVEAAKTSGSLAPLMLDGVLWTRELKTDVAIKYFGKGILGSEPNPDVTTQDASMAYPIVAGRTRLAEAQATGDAAPGDQWKDQNKRWNTANYLTLIYQGAGGDAALNGSQMITFKAKSVTDSTLGGSVPANVEGTLFSTQGIKPEGGKSITILGNYVCGVVNKQKNPTDGKILVDYDQRLLARRKHESADVNVTTFTKGDWHNLSVSPRVSGYFEKQ